MDQGRVFAFLQARQAAGQRCVLVTVLSVEGSSMRNPGTHMGVAEDGSFAGSLSGGCIENAVVAEALATLTAGAPRVVRFGAGSPFVDIKLPCGGGLDIHFQPLDGPGLVGRACEAIAAREPFSIRIDEEARFLAGWHRGDRAFGHWPELRLLIVGHGAGVEALARLARAMELGCHVLTPDPRILASLGTQGLAVTKLERTSDTHLLASDPWTAIVFLFHDHDWEAQLMAQALALPHCALSAMGSRKAHAARCEALASAGVGADAIASIRAPLGLFHSSRDPETLALSALGEIVQAYLSADFGARIG
ncbi:XdhC family protein [Erythrobacter sp. SDW2]|uniref:XdhC family protein n=1 Tax=Erythrobacter sp. SDW2 TaxID=2907154 RepID=UPI001F26F8B3|nr:XdhC family protein [Erythrobacter sp. SDW2]UIP07647.1 XdhC family protein [Erythrobacter sp. SDW2]